MNIFHSNLVYQLRERKKSQEETDKISIISYSITHLFFLIKYKSSYMLYSRMVHIRYCCSFFKLKR
jgi:hypothetical protein